jgi:DNA-directed RNA polymerase alpha subunit
MMYFGQGGPPEVSTPGSVAVPERLQDLFERSIDDVAELSVRSRNSLQKENIRTLGDLVQRSEDEMLNIENFGKKSLKEISDLLDEHGLRFGMQLEEGDDGRLFFVDQEAEATSSGEE